MRRTPLLAVALLGALAAVPAHADAFFNYSGTLIVNGEDDIVYPDFSVLHTYNNEPVAASLTIHRVDVPFNSYYLVDNYSIALYENTAPAEIYADFLSCADFSNCVEVDYLSSASNFPPGPDPLPSVAVYGFQNFGCTETPGQDCVVGDEYYSGTLNLVTANTPEPSTVALLGTGLLGLGGFLRKRRV